MIPRWLRTTVHAAAFALALPTLAEGERPVIVGIDAEFGVQDSQSAQAIRLGAAIAIEEINAAGGVLGGRPLALVEKDNRSVPARSIRNLRELADDPDVVAVLSGRFSPVVVEALPVVHELGLPLLGPWAAADPITDHALRPNYVFRLSLKDTWALQTLLTHASTAGHHRVGLLLANTEWGRSSERAARAFVADRDELRIAAVQWFNWGEESLIEHYQTLRAAGAETVIFVTNEREGVVLVREIAGLPAAERLPVLAHWGITGGRFFENAREFLDRVDLLVVQTFSFLDSTGLDSTAQDAAPQDATRAVAERVLAAAAVRGNPDPRSIAAPVGVAHAYDLVHVLARAIDLAGSAERARVRDALEQVSDYTGLVRHYDRPFTPERHDALGPEDVFMARYAADGAIERVRQPHAGP